MDVIEISSDSDSDCVVSPQPPFKKRRTTFYREQMKEARSKIRDEAPLPRKIKKMAVEETREDRIADKERQRGEEKHAWRQRRQAARSGSDDAIVVASGPAVEESEQRQGPRDVRDEAVAGSLYLPFPMTVPAPVAAPAVAVAIPAAPSSAASPRFRADKGTQPLPALPIAAEKPSLPDTVASAEKPTPTGSNRELSLRASAVADSSDPPTLQKSPRQASLDQSRCLQQQHTRPGNTAPALPAPLQAVMAHWGRVWRRPGQLFRRQADDDATR
ncbi:hypothetical protein BBO_00047 [Beauveria brongniartii RCEF 3172]|uniref:Uncharacterized protein n=1 Tax=Beauveria brongniartii RCEF 3172 TaxID=1081107 RepID=A0A167KUC1_9HYPO|nr:hypothetical protein BBO_00047 [Beauveria brongniartii RCEF 3172]